MSKATAGTIVQAIQLNRANLGRFQAPVHTPGYDPAAVRAGIVHLGLGGFHRAHMARYTHDLMQAGADALGWGIVGAGLMPADRRMQESLAPQDRLYTLVERSFAEETVTIIGSLADVVFAGESSATLLDAIDRPEIRIVSLTVTEHGYCLNRSTKVLDPAHPLIVKDLAQPQQPASAIGIIVEAYRRRRASGTTPFTALSCDNIQHNGRVLRDAVLALAELRDPALAAWIAANGAFPNTMVDRITPVTAEADVTVLAERFGIIDRWPVFAETFTQWVIEDHFPAGRPAWENVGAQFVPDVAPYEFMKLRLLNGSHLAVSGMGRLADYVTIDEAMADPLMTRFMVALMDRETGPTLPPVPGIDLAQYKKTLVERFANPAIKDTVERVNTDAPLNILVDPIRDCLRANAPIELLGLALAAWLRRVRGEDEHGRPIDIRHPLAETLRERAIQGGSDPRPLLALTGLFGELGDDARLVGTVGRWLASLYAQGSRATLAEAAHTLAF
ncbi:mannitol dehydrogenase family protein [Acidisphaera sp. L21]|uniref:mannitol dehydrogenase family protein n=1 Tax=Acidisphaera sp. L21 TaxID=1641851 RepID=UPI00131C802D|nr:mannitol dehydrogenase family protein [Acidisphaera sp. L21]